MEQDRQWANSPAAQLNSDTLNHLKYSQNPEDQMIYQKIINQNEGVKPVASVPTMGINRIYMDKNPTAYPISERIKAIPEDVANRVGGFLDPLRDRTIYRNEGPGYSARKNGRAYPGVDTGGAAPIDYEALANHIQETEYEDPRVNTEGMDYQIPGPQGDYFVQPKVAINNGIEELVTRAKKENDDQHRHRLMQDNIKDMKFIQQNPNWFLNPLIDAQIKDRYRYMKDQGLI